MLNKHELELYKIILKPIITEKSNNQTEKHEQAVFKVLRSATKKQVKDAFELIFKVKVKAVNILNIKSSPLGAKKGRPGRHAHWKKAYISLQPNQNFDLSSQ